MADSCSVGKLVKAMIYDETGVITKEQWTLLESTLSATQNFTKLFEDTFQEPYRYFFYLIGPPAAGKTTVLNLALQNARLALTDPPQRFTHNLVKRGATKPIGVYLGKRREGFGGTDALPMNAITGVIDQMVKERPSLVVGEGDRLANDRFFHTMKDLGYELCLYHLGANDEVLRKRRRQRGSDQNEAWVKGRTTKSLRLANGWSAMKLNGTLPVEKNARIIARAITDRLSLAEERVN